MFLVAVLWRVQPTIPRQFCFTLNICCNNICGITKCRRLFLRSQQCRLIVCDYVVECLRKTGSCFRRFAFCCDPLFNHASILAETFVVSAYFSKTARASAAVVSSATVGPDAITDRSLPITSLMIKFTTVAPLHCAASPPPFNSERCFANRVALDNVSPRIVAAARRLAEALEA